MAWNCCKPEDNCLPVYYKRFVVACCPHLQVFRAVKEYPPLFPLPSSRWRQKAPTNVNTVFTSEATEHPTRLEFSTRL
jgi:hypothetical protein